MYDSLCCSVVCQHSTKQQNNAAEVNVKHVDRTHLHKNDTDQFNECNSRESDRMDVCVYVCTDWNLIDESESSTFNIDRNNEQR